MARPDKNVPTREEIERRAYEIYLQRGGTDGGDIADWVAAEKELNGQKVEPVTDRKPLSKSHAASK